MNKVFGFSTSNVHIKNNLDDIASIAQFFRLHQRFPSRNSTDNEERRLSVKLSKLRGAKNGLPYCAWFPQYEKLAKALECPDMFKPVDRKNKTLLVIKKIAEFYCRHGRYASQYSEDIEERKLWAKRASLKQAKKGKGAWKWFPEYDILAEKLGLPNMFEEIRRIENRLDVIKKIADFYLKNKRLPKICSDPYEKKLRSQLNTLRVDKKGKNWKKCYDDLVKKLGCPEILTLCDYKANRLADVKLIASFFKRYGRLPSRYSKEVGEKKLAEKLHNLKKAKKQKSRYLWYREYEELAKSLGCPNMFMPIKPS